MPDNVAAMRTLSSCGYVIDDVVVELRAVPDNVAAMRTLSSKLVSLGRVYGCSDRYFPLGNERATRRQPGGVFARIVAWWRHCPMILLDIRTFRRVIAF